MTYFKNVELGRKYRISEATVRNWVKIAKEGKLKLALEHVDGRYYVANTPSNLKVVEELVTANKKYRNTRSMKTIEPKPEFYQVFNQNEIYEIVRNLEKHHEIPREYNYFNTGGVEWDKYIKRLVDEGAPNLANHTIELLAENQSYIDKRLSGYKRVNVVDIGVGNALPTKDFLAHLLDKGVLGRYIAVDISPTMLEIAERNIKQWFGNQVAFEGHQLDVAYERFADLLAKDYLKSDSNDSMNVLVLFGGTAENLRIPDDALRTINESMNPDDLFVYCSKLTKEAMRPEWFDHTSKPGKLALSSMHRVVFDLLNIDESLYEVEMGFDERERQLYARVRLTIAFTLQFTFDDGQREVTFEKGDTILLWRFRQMTALDTFNQFDRNGFYTLHSSQTEDRQYILSIAEIKD